MNSGSFDLWAYAVIAFALVGILMLAIYFAKFRRSPAACPRCGTKVITPRKSWAMAGRPDKLGKRVELTIGLFDCPRCGKAFRKVLSKRRI